MGLAVKVAVGAAGAVTVTLAEAVAEPPAPVQLTEYVVFVVGDTVAAPEVPLAVKLVPVHDVALFEEYVRFAD